MAQLKSENEMMPIADLGERMEAAVVDGSITYLIAAIFTMLIVAVCHHIGSTLSDLKILYLLIGSQFLVGLSVNIYGLSCERGVQTTLGMRSFGLTIERLNGEKLTLTRTTIRWFFAFISAGFFMIGYFLAFFTKNRQTLHDLILDTVVVKR